MYKHFQGMRDADGCKVVMRALKKPELPDNHPTLENMVKKTEGVSFFTVYQSTSQAWILIPMPAYCWFTPKKVRLRNQKFLRPHITSVTYKRFSLHNCFEFVSFG